MKIAVISDTHDRLPAGLPGRLAKADAIWHLGDVCRPETLLDLEALGIPMKIVSGNCDYLNLWPGALQVEVNGRRFHLEHIAPRSVPAGVDFVLSGHTHVPSRRTEGLVTWLNPGCISRPNQGAPASFAWLTVADDGACSWEPELI